MSTEANKTFEYFCLATGDRNHSTLALDSRWIVDIRPLAGFRLAEHNDSAYGHLDWQRQEVAVHRLDSILGRPESRLSREQRIMIINSQPAWGLLVENELPVAKAPVDGITSAPNSFTIERESIVEGLFADEHGIVTLLEPTRLQRALFGRANGPSWPTPGSAPAWPATSMVERAEARVRASMFMRSGLQLVVFRSANLSHQGHLFAFSLSQVIEVETPSQIQTSAIDLPDVLGVSGWREWPIPILDWEYMIGLGSSNQIDPENKRMLICVSARGDFAGLLVGPDVETIRLPRATYSGDSQGLYSDRIAGTYNYQNEQLVLLDINRLILPTTPTH